MHETHRRGAVAEAAIALAAIRHGFGVWADDYDFGSLPLHWRAQGP